MFARAKAYDQADLWRSSIDGGRLLLGPARGAPVSGLVAGAGGLSPSGSCPEAAVWSN